MTSRISVEVVENLLFRLAEIIGPAAAQYVKILKESRAVSPVEWERLARTFSSVSHLDILEEACFIAMNRGDSDAEGLTEIVKEVERAELN